MCAKIPKWMNSKNRIYGGLEADSPIPWQVQMKTTKTREVDCGGTILNRDTILTAAHCKITKRSHFVVAGVTDSRNGLLPASPQAQTSRIKRVINHPNFIPEYPTQKSFHFDITILKLKSPFKFNRDVNFACLPAPNFSTQKRGLVSGWGYLKQGMYRKVASINMS